MLTKLIAILIILAGIAGLILPVIPGILLITIGVLLLYRDKLGEIRRLLPEKIPAFAAAIYNSTVTKMLMPYYGMIRDEIVLSEGQFLLDVGTGPGILAIELAGKFPRARVAGIDLSEKMIELADKNKSLHPDLSNLEFRVMDAKALEFPDNSFDMIISTGSMHHWKDPLRILNEIYRCLKPGRSAWIYDGSADAKDADIEKSVKRLWGILPSNAMVRYALGIHGYTGKEYDGEVAAVISKSDFKEYVSECRGVMMRIILTK